MEQSNANPIGFGVVSSTVTPLQTLNTTPSNLILAPIVSSEPRGHPKLGTSSQSSSSEVLVVIDEPSAIVSSDNATISQVYESYIDDNGDHRYRVAHSVMCVQGKKECDHCR